MNKRNVQERPTGLWRLSWPIGIELLLQSLMGTIDTLMVSRIGDQAVSAVGVSNQVIQAVLTLFSVIVAGAGIVLARKWGAQDWDAARKTVILSTKLILIAGCAAGLIIGLGAGVILHLMGVPGTVFDPAHAYLTIVGSSMLVVVLHMAVNSMIRNTGNTRGPMYITIGMNLLHLVLNYALIFGISFFPEMGVSGTAVSTVVSRILALAFAAQLLWRSFTPPIRRSEWRGYDRKILREMLRIGLPISMTAASWGYSQILLLSIVASMGANALASFTYLQTIQQFPWLLASSIGAALQIQVSHLYGARRFSELRQSVYRAIWPGLALILCLSLLLFIEGREVMTLFTSDRNIIQLTLPLLGLCVLWQCLRIMPFCISGSLNVIGEAKFVGLLSILGMWFVSTGGAYLLGVSAGLGLRGVLMAFMADEIFRGSFFLVRWLRTQAPTMRTKGRIKADIT